MFGWSNEWNPGTGSDNDNFSSSTFSYSSETSSSSTGDRSGIGGGGFGGFGDGSGDGGRASGARNDGVASNWRPRVLADSRRGSGAGGMEISSTTKNRFKSARITWEIRDFFKLMRHADEEHNFLTSAAHVIPIDGVEGQVRNVNLTAEIGWNKEKFEEENQGHVGIYVFAPTPTTVTYTAYLRRRDGDLVEVLGETTHRLNDYRGGSDRALSKADLERDSEVLVPGGALTIVLDVEIFCEIEQEAVRPGSGATADEKALTLGRCLKRLPGDVRLRAGPEFAVSCHRVVLQSRSEVLAAMLLRNAAEDEIHVADLTPEALKYFVDFLYLDECEATSMEVLCQLLAASERYLVPLLKSACQGRLRKSLSITNVCQISALAEAHRADQLLEDAVEFMAGNADKVVECQGWGQVSAAVVRKVMPLALKKKAEERAHQQLM